MLVLTVLFLLLWHITWLVPYAVVNDSIASECVVCAGSDLYSVSLSRCLFCLFRLMCSLTNVFFVCPSKSEITGHIGRMCHLLFHMSLLCSRAKEHGLFSVI